MGEKVNRIEREFVLKSLVEKRLPATARCGLDSVQLRIVELSDTALVVEPEHPVPWRAGEQIEVFFTFQNNNHTLSGRVAAVVEGRFRLEFPGSLYKSLQRDFQRVRQPEGFNVSFRLAGAGAVDLTFPASGAPAAELPLEPAKAFDPAAIKDLIDEFNERAGAETSEGRIVMMRNRVANTYEERVMQATGKAFWIPSTDGDFPGRDPVPDPRVLTRAEMVQYEKAFGTEPALILSRLADIIYQKRRQGVDSELCWPLLHGRFFVGYLHLLAHSDKKRIGRPLVDWIGEFAMILGYSLEHGGYFSSEGTQVRPYQAEAVDLSASGLLFAHPDKELYKKLLVHSDIQVALKARNRRMTVGGRVVRKLMDRDRVYIALRFLEISQEDFRYLHEALYGRAFDPENVVSEISSPVAIPPGQT